MESITFVPCGIVPLYQQLYTYFVAEIRAGQLKKGEKLPSKRRLAADLQLSVNTVDTAYQMLVAEGYLVARAKSGFYVQAAERLSAPVARQQPRIFSAQKKQYRYNFETASIDTSLFPFKTWRRLQRDILAGNPSLLNHGQRQGDENLREAIATYLHEYRGAQCSAAQIVVGAGIEYLLGLLARLFCDKVFAVENPGYARTHRVLENSGASVNFVPLDAGGLSVEALKKSAATLAYVTPSHQFPAGITMPAGRRADLLQWAQETDSYIIEDDYDSEFRFDVKPLPCLQGLDDSGRVIYISTFSKSIAPAIRIGYMVLPEKLLPRFEAEFGFYSSTVSRFEQQTLCRFMQDGYFARHLNRLRNAYRQRKNALVSALNDAFGRQNITISGSHTGLHLLLQLHSGMTEAQLCATAENCGVHVNGLSAYYQKDIEACPAATVVLGYAAMSCADIENAVALLKTAWT